MQARAVVARGPRQVVFQAVEVPEPAPEDVVVQVQHSWISNGTEGSFLRGERIGGDTPWREGDTLPFPLVPGYQKVGVVQWTGAEAGDLRVGDVVMAATSRVRGMARPSGGHVSPAVTPRSQVWKLPAGLPPEAASGMVLTQVGYNCGMRPAIGPGDAAVVIGDGLVGHWSAQTLVQRGARVLLLGRHDDRLERFTCRDLDLCVNTSRADGVAAIAAWAPEGVQAVIDTVGSVASIESLYPLLRRNGHIVSAGFHGTQGLIDIQRLRDSELTLHAPAGWTRPRMDATLDWLAAGKLKTLPLISHRLPVERAADAFALILDRQPGVLGVVLQWT